MSQVNITELAKLHVKSNRKGLTFILANKEVNSCIVLNLGRIIIMTYSAASRMCSEMDEGTDVFSLNPAYIPVNLYELQEIDGDVSYELLGEYQL
jgi:hypothetical protein